MVAGLAIEFHLRKKKKQPVLGGTMCDQPWPAWR
jgi:hypothetical protein